MKKIKDLTVWLYSTHIGRIAFSAFLLILGGVMMGQFKSTWVIWEVIMWAGITGLVIHFIIMMYYAIIGTANDILNK